MIQLKIVTFTYNNSEEKGNLKNINLSINQYRKTPHTAAGKDHFPNRSLCDPVGDRVSTRTSSSMR